jgi:hypothetical protein
MASQQGQNVEISLDMLRRISMSWRSLDSLRAKAENAFNKANLPNSKRDGWVENYILDNMPSGPLVMTELLMQEPQTTSTPEFNAALLAKILRTQNLEADLKITEEALEDAGVMQVKFKLSGDTVKAIVGTFTEA